MKVIVIEDNILFCDYICSLLQKADFKTMKAHGLAQAKKMIKAAGRGKYRLVEMDEG